MQHIKQFTAVVAGCAAATTLWAAPVTHYTQARTSSTGAAYGHSADGGCVDADCGYYFVQNNNGTPSALVAGGTANVNRRNHVNGQAYSQRVVTAESASANLSAGQLKASAGVTVSNTTGSPPSQTGGGDSHYSTAYSVMADTFDLAGFNGAPFAWTPETRFTFSLNLNGLASVAPSLLKPAGSTEGSFAYAQIFFSTYKAGTLELMAQRDALYGFFDQPGVIDQINVLSRQINANGTGIDWWVLGDHNVPDSWLPSITGHEVDVSQGDVTLSYSFRPGEAFDWIASLDLSTRLEEGLTDVSTVYDFSHTVSLGFTAPAGATVLSASGLFPQTQALLPANGVPAPSPASLLLLPLACLALRTASQRRNAKSKN